MEKLNLGVAYHGNRFLSEVERDMRDIINHNFNTVIHMFSHNDWVRSSNVMKDIFDCTTQLGLDFWVDNWGLGGSPGDPSHFLSYHPEAHQYFSDGEMIPNAVCMNNEAYVSWTKEWIDTVYEIGGRKIFWDEPHLKSESERFACGCPTCKKLFKERYGREMPVIPDKDCFDFQEWTIVNYFKKVTDYSHSKGMLNSVCVMLHQGIGINLDNISALETINNMDNIGTDPYWISSKRPQFTGTHVYKFVYEASKKCIDAAQKVNKGHNIWIQSYNNPVGYEEDIVHAADAAYAAGARNIFFWGYRGCEGNNYRAKAPEFSWRAAGDAAQRLLNKERDRIELLAQKELKIK